MFFQERPAASYQYSACIEFSPAVKALLDALNQGCASHPESAKVCVAGGFVRDHCLSVAVHDLDLITTHKLGPLMEVVLALQAVGVVGTVKTSQHRSLVSFTLFGRGKDQAWSCDVSYDHPGFSKKQLELWANSCDFMGNNLLASIDGRVYDYGKGGLQACQQRELQLAGSVQAFKNDPMRPIRAVYLCLRLNFSLSAELARLMDELDPVILASNQERISQYIHRKSTEQSSVRHADLTEAQARALIQQLPEWCRAGFAVFLDGKTLENNGGMALRH